MRGWIFLLAVVIAGPTRATDFRNDIMPVLTKAGCNTGACHGAAVGRGGFRLSLYGGDPGSDFRSIARELEGRRINLADPKQSLLVVKPTETIEHGGGQRLDSGEEGASRIVEWIEQGARWNGSGQTDQTPRSQFVGLTVSPQQVVASTERPTVQLSAVAHFSDGSDRDVTQWTVFTPEDPSAVRFEGSDGQATIGRRGRHVVVAHYLSEVVPVEIIMPFDGEVVDANSDTSTGLIDRHVSDLLHTLRIPMSAAADDATFLRRVTLDLTGRLPDSVTTQRFVTANGLGGEGAPNRRAILTSDLLESDEFNEYWTLQLAKLLRVHTQPQDTQGAATYHRWIHRQLVDRVGYDQMASELLLASRGQSRSWTGEFLSDRGGTARASGTDERSLHGQSPSLCQLSQPSVGSLDARRLPRPGGDLCRGAFGTSGIT